MKPRRVRSGVKLSTDPEQLMERWASQRWLRAVETEADGDAHVEGIEYAQLGQTRRMELVAGSVRADVQGRSSRPYNTRVELTQLSHDDWERVLGALLENPPFTARILAAELPSNVDDIFGPLGLHLFPSGSEDLRSSCTCNPDAKWCKHAWCLLYLTAQRLAIDPFEIFTLRGLARDELIERLRQRRALTSSVQGSAPVYVAHIPGITEGAAPPLESCLEEFWDVGPQLETVDLPIEPPQVSHPLLRRLGPSPFEDGQFPLVGLLATCYEVISEAALASPPEMEQSNDL